MAFVVPLSQYVAKRDLEMRTIFLSLAALLTSGVARADLGPAERDAVEALDSFFGRFVPDESSSGPRDVQTFEGVNEYGLKCLFYRPDVASGPRYLQWSILSQTRDPYGRTFAFQSHFDC